jgi:hypothetical protein
MGDCLGTPVDHFLCTPWSLKWSLNFYLFTVHIGWDQTLAPTFPLIVVLEQKPIYTNTHLPYLLRPWRWRQHVLLKCWQHFYIHTVQRPKSRININSEIPQKPKISIHKFSRILENHSLTVLKILWVLKAETFGYYQLSTVTSNSFVQK